MAFALAATSMPVAIGIAILRYRLYAIDRIISRTISYAVITAVLVAVFAIVVIGLQALLARFTSGDTVPVAASTLVVFALFQPLRRRVQATIDRHFYRARYDAERTQAELAARLKNNVDLESLAKAVRSVVDATIAPASVGLWLGQARRTAGGDRSHALDDLAPWLLTVGLFVALVGSAAVASQDPDFGGGGPADVVAFALFQPLRKRIHGAMDRRFNRSPVRRPSDRERLRDPASRRS